MEPYRVLLADDEEEIRVGISRKIDWAGLGFQLVGEAENGQEALELAGNRLAPLFGGAVQVSVPLLTLAAPVGLLGVRRGASPRREAADEW